MWKELLRIAPDLIPVIIQTILDVEMVISGVRHGDLKKSRVMSIIGSILDTKDYFLNRDSDGRQQVMNLVSMFIDVTVSTFNYTGLFASKDTLDFSPIPIDQEGNDEGD